MHVKVPADIREAHKVRQLALPRRVDLTVVLAQFWLDIREAEILVNLVLGPSCDASGAIKQAIFIELEPA